MNRRVLFYVQHLLGIGHLTRAATLARALVSEGFEVTVVSGGEAVAVLDRSGFELVQLPPVRAPDRTFQGLEDADGSPVDEAYLVARRQALLACHDRRAPAIVLIEMYPFGRRALRGEIEPLIAAAKAGGAKIVCSVRDILVEKNRPDREAEMVDVVRAQFDAVLVHGDPHLIPFDATFPPAKRIADLIHYTGYVVDDTPSLGPQGTGEAIVSAGSGATGEKLLRTALAARPLTSLSRAPWRLLAGPRLDEKSFRALADDAPAGVTVERARADFTTLLANCAVSISQGGYNTVMEVLASGAPAVLVPYAGGNETEQTLRARALAGRGWVERLDEDVLCGSALAQAVDRALEKARRGMVDHRAGLDLSGAKKTAEFLASRLLRIA